MGRILLRHFGSVSVSAGYPKRHLRPNTRSGARSTATTSARTRRWTSTPPPVGISASAQERQHQAPGGSGSVPAPGRFRFLDCTQEWNAVPGGVAAGVSHCDGDVRRWPSPRPPTHGGDRWWAQSFGVLLSMNRCTSSSTGKVLKASLIVSIWWLPPTSSCASTMPQWSNTWTTSKLNSRSQTH